MSDRPTLKTIAAMLASRIRGWWTFDWADGGCCTCGVKPADVVYFGACGPDDSNEPDWAQCWRCVDTGGPVDRGRRQLDPAGNKRFMDSLRSQTIPGHERTETTS